MSNGDYVAAISHWLIEPRELMPSSGAGLRHMIVAADSAAAARQVAEHWRMSRPYDIDRPFTDQHSYLVRRLPDHEVGAPNDNVGVVHSEIEPSLIALS